MVSQMSLPHVSRINDRESLLFFNGGLARFACVVCAGSCAETPVVRSSGHRIETLYLKAPSDEFGDGTRLAGPICWACVRNGTRGSNASHRQWRAAAAGFLNDLYASDPISYYCGLQDLG